MSTKTRIKVGDLLLNIGQSDIVSFSSIYLDTIVGLDKIGISGSIHVQSIDNTTIVARLDNVYCAIHDVSDLSGDLYIRKVFVTDFIAYFILSSALYSFNKEDDASVFLINEKSMFIDISDMLYEAIILQTPFVKRTPIEETLYNNIPPENLDDFGDNFLGGQIVFRPGKKH